MLYWFLRLKWLTIRDVIYILTRRKQDDCFDDIATENSLILVVGLLGLVIDVISFGSKCFTESKI